MFLHTCSVYLWRSRICYLILIKIKRRRSATRSTYAVFYKKILIGNFLLLIFLCCFASCNAYRSSGRFTPRSGKGKNSAAKNKAIRRSAKLSKTNNFAVLSARFFPRRQITAQYKKPQRATTAAAA